MAGSIAQSVGVDIAKDTLEVHLHPAREVRRFANSAKGHAALTAWLGGFAIARVAFEPTGAYHHAFERRLAEAGHAAMLPRFAPLLEPPVRPVVSAALDTMKELHVARRALVKDRVAAQN